jgi:hypothetical protein
MLICKALEGAWPGQHTENNLHDTGTGCLLSTFGQLDFNGALEGVVPGYWCYTGRLPTASLILSVWHVATVLSPTMQSHARGIMSLKKEPGKQGSRACYILAGSCWFAGTAAFTHNNTGATEANSQCLNNCWNNLLPPLGSHHVS